MLDFTPIKSQLQLNIYNRCKEADINESIKRAELCQITSLSDRAMRNEIGKMRDNGVRICGTSRDAGYWLARGEDDFNKFLNDYSSPVWTKLRRINAMKSSVIGQIGM